MTTADLARELEVSDVAARRLAMALEGAGLLAPDQAEPTGRGRPATIWRLTEAARAHFPDAHAELTINLISATRRAVGAKGLQKVIDARTRDMVARYAERMPPPSASLKQRLEALARIRTDEGYMARVQRESQGVYLLIENHCPICDAAETCQGLCTAELDLFKKALGPDADIERTEHLLAGATRCVYRVRCA